MTQRPYHRLWLLSQARTLFDFFGANARNPAGGFYTLDDNGNPLANQQQQLFDTCRMVHCFAAGHQLGHPGAMHMVDHGMSFLIEHHYDTTNGGFFWEVDQNGPTNAAKRAYGHAFVLLAAASAHEIRHPKAKQLCALAMHAIDTHFWDENAGALREEFNADWTGLKDYRGQNANMHTVEALMAAYEAFGDARYLSMAQRIADLIINRHARAANWVVIEHFNADWTPDLTYSGDPMFGPAGTTPGHALEWSRLLVQLWHLGDQSHAWMPTAAANLFHMACQTGWDQTNGGFYYTLDFKNQPDQRVRIWWPACEGVAAAAALQTAFEDTKAQHWYAEIWAVISRDFIDPNGGWWPVPQNAVEMDEHPFQGKPDLYHSVQACLLPLLPPSSGLLKGLLKVLL
ncbi:AGE family epimerase/isomerase [Pacificibacter maritimus]|nr:AGE family epimerase/isomerase [Pacificibacter maritimus]